ncbi:interleukin-22 receptor subunit alpha-1-like [Tiliqua scincoides]|uniref:interleukin-22 receptor subunit alpha-1-like n=1 Tax=Tiliqua scincoides TaxID=71010 RepID=UPI003461CF89
MKTFLLLWLSCSLAGNLLAERSQLLQKPTFVSINFDNILTWETTEEVPPGTVYDVEYKKYGELWQEKSECKNISQQFCNLTSETEMVTERYYARVRAVVPNCCISKWIISDRFCPREDTNIGDIDVKYIPSARSIKFSVQPPYTALRDEDNQVLTIEDIFSQYGKLEYHITMFCHKTQKTWVLHMNNKVFELSDLDPDTKYNGTIQMIYKEKKSKPHEFWVSTLPDNTWLLYLFGVAVFMTLSIFATICCFIYKYIKRHAVKQPMSLDLKDIPHFQTLMLSTEHILTLRDPSKPPPISPETQLAQINQHLQGVLEHPTSSTLPETSYRQQAKVAPFKPLAHPQNQADRLPMGYTPQVVKSNPSCRLDNNLSTSTYGVCVEGAGSTDKTNLPPNEGLRLESLVEVPITDGHYRAQKPPQIETGLCRYRTQRVPAVVKRDSEQIKQQLFEEISQNMPQRLPYLLQEGAPTALGEGPGSYRKKTMELPPCILETTQNAISEDHHLLPSMSQSLLEHCACDTLSQDHSMGQRHAAWDSCSWTDSQWQPSGFQMTDHITQTSKVSKNEIKPHNADTLDFALDNGLFIDLFRDLELKVQWDQETDEKAGVY